MIDQAVVIVSDWLKDPIYGLNTILETLPSPVRNPHVHIFDEMRDEPILTMEGPIKFPCVMVLGNSEGEWKLNNRESGAKGEVELFVPFAVEESSPVLANKILAGRVMRAVRKSLKRLTIAKYRHERGIGTYEQVELVEVTRLTQQRVTGTIAGLRLSNAVVAKILMLDLEP